MSLSPGFLDDLRARSSLAKVVERKVSWDARKSNAAKGDYWACCPFHQEKSSSFHVDDRKGFYYCFGCHAKGDAITFLKDAENMEFMEAVETLAREAGMEMPDRDPQAARRDNRRTELAEVMELAARHFAMQLRAGAGQAARDYVASRGLTEKTVARFGLGFAPDARTSLRDALTAKGVDVRMLDEAGLVIVPDDGGAPFDRFRGRLIFPIRDQRGRCIAFGGRAMSPEARAKYLNSPETPLFDKGRTLFNFGPAREAAGKMGALIVAEGYMDVIALAQAGFDHAVAPLGTAITEEQLRLMWRIADEPVIALDGDEAGLRAAMRLVGIALPLLEAGKSLRFALMPEGRDPDDLIRAEGPAAMQAALDRALPMVEMLWRRETEDRSFDSPERRAALDARLRDALRTIGDDNLRAHYAQALRDRRAKLFAPAGGPAGAGERRRFGPDRKGGRARTGVDPFAMPTSGLKSSALVRDSGRETEARGREAALLLTLINHPELAQRRIEALEDVDFVCRDLDVLRNALISVLTGFDDAPDRTALLDRIERVSQTPPLAVLMSAPSAREIAYAAPGSDPEAAEYGFEETLSRHRALMLAMREVAEAEVEMGADAGEDTDRRLAAAMSRRLVDAAPSPVGDDEDETHLSNRLREAIDGEIWVKARKGRS